MSDGALNTVDLKQALEGAGFEVNSALWDALDDLRYLDHTDIKVVQD